jgi:hypothetical protein
LLLAILLSQHAALLWCREGLGANIKRIAKQITSALPIIGLVSRLTATEGGIGNDAQARPSPPHCLRPATLGGGCRMLPICISCFTAGMPVVLYLVFDG